MKRLKVIWAFLPMLVLLFPPRGPYEVSFSVVSLLGPFMLFCAAAVILITSESARSLRSLDTLLQSGIFAALAGVSAALGLYVPMLFLPGLVDVLGVLSLGGLGIGAGLQALLTLCAARLAYGLRFHRFAYLFMFLLGTVGYLVVIHTVFRGSASNFTGPRLDSAVWYSAIAFALPFEVRRVVAGRTPSAAAAAPGLGLGVRRRRNGWALIAVLVLGLAAACALVALTVVSYDGYCYGFTDGKSPCPIWQSVMNQAFFGLIFLWPLVFVWIALIVLLAIQYIRATLACRGNVKTVPDSGRPHENR